MLGRSYLFSKAYWWGLSRWVVPLLPPRTSYHETHSLEPHNFAAPGRSMNHSDTRTESPTLAELESDVSPPVDSDSRFFEDARLYLSAYTAIYALGFCPAY